MAREDDRRRRYLQEEFQNSERSTLPAEGHASQNSETPITPSPTHRGLRESSPMADDPSYDLEREHREGRDVSVNARVTSPSSNVLRLQGISAIVTSLNSYRHDIHLQFVIIIRREEDHQARPERVLQRREHRLQGENVCWQCQPYPGLLHPSPCLRFSFAYDPYNTNTQTTTTVTRETPSGLVLRRPYKAGISRQLRKISSCYPLQICVV